MDLKQIMISIEVEITAIEEDRKNDFQQYLPKH